MIKTVNNWLNIIQYSLISPSCIFCGKPGTANKDCCLTCQNAFTKLGSQCVQCANPIEVHLINQQYCGRCQKNPRAFTQVYAPYLHQGEIRYLINQLKFKKSYKNSRLLGLLLTEFLLEKQVTLPNCLIPVPLHPSRYRQRGYNQTLEVAKVISKELCIPIDYTSCIRTQNTPHQISLNSKQRHQNIKGAFKVQQPITTKHIAILDDVMSTGATAHELAQTLITAGAIKVDIWICARA